MVATINMDDSGNIVHGREQLKNALKHCRKGVHIIRITYAGVPKNIAEARRHYFAICDMLCDEGNTGYTGKELHEILKRKVLPIVDESFNSTTKLSLDNWVEYIDEVKRYIKETFNFYL